MKDPAPSLTLDDRRRRWRRGKDFLARHLVTVGGIGVIVAILLIFFYLLSVVLPMFKSAEMEAESAYPVPGEGETAFMIVEERGEFGGRLLDDGRFLFFRMADGGIENEFRIPLPANVRISAVAPSQIAKDLYVLGMSDGSVLPLRVDYKISYPDDVRLLEPSFEYPLGETPVATGSDAPVEKLAGQVGDDSAVFVVQQNGQLNVVAVEVETNFLSGAREVSDTSRVPIPERLANNEPAEYLLVDPRLDWLYVAGRSGQLMMFSLENGDAPQLNQRVQLAIDRKSLTNLSFLNGGISLLTGFSDGEIAQWFPLRDEHNRYTLEFVRSFEGGGAAVTAITPEHRRKGFVAGYADGKVGIYYTTSQRRLLIEQVAESAVGHLAISPRSSQLAVLSANGTLSNWHVDNEHPEISWSSLWGKVWYESYPEPDYIWQSSAATNDFEPKFSLVPLSVGTLKAAFYAMLIAVPLAIFGAIYTAYFMAPKMRQLVKPTLEIMEALPTVILGFLAGLWLAPFIESTMPGLFLLVLLMPPMIIAVGFLWSRLPTGVRHAVPDGWQVALLIVPVIATSWFCFAISGPVETLLFGGNMPQWVSTELDIPFDQRNAVVVGFAMGFAVIPTIFSIAEDALFEVPKHLSYGSLALGATPWQTLVRVIIPTASPGIFSALMIGLGRAVGETMIVLMATGNTPIMNWNIFEGMRTLSANIAVEMPESEVASTHYRVLFLAALVLFLFTFIVNTGAELIRQRLRRKYSTI